MNINRTVISGRLTKDPELKKIGDVDLCNFRIASNRIVGKKKVEKSIFIDVDIWGGLAAQCEKSLRKGSRIIAEGILCQDSWEGKNGEKNSKVYIEADNVIFMDFKEDGKGVDREEKSATEAPASKAAPQSKPAAKTAPKPVDDEDIPF